MRYALASIALIGSMVGGFLVPTVANPGGVAYHIYYLGDSITFGRSATTYAHSYRALVAAYLAQNPRVHVTIENQPDDLTRYSATWHSGWKLVDALTAEAATPPQAATNLIVVEIGTNDSGSSTPIAAFTSGYAQLITSLVAAAPGAEVVCLTSWDTPVHAAAYDAVIQADCPAGRTVDLSALYAQAALHGPVGTKESWLGTYTTDSFHPNDKGHSAIAAEIEAWL